METKSLRKSCPEILCRKTVIIDVEGMEQITKKLCWTHLCPHCYKLGRETKVRFCIENRPKLTLEKIVTTIVVVLIISLLFTVFKFNTKDQALENSSYGN